MGLFFVVTLIFSLYLFVECSFPKYFDCMKIVKNYLSFKELKSFIEKEEFERFELNGISHPFNFYYSKKWLFVDNVYIPRKVVLDLIAVNKSLFSPYTKIGIITQNGESVLLAQVKNEEADLSISKLKKEFSEFKCDIEIYSKVYCKEFHKENQRNFKEKITNKEEFIKYCEISHNF